MEKKKWWSMWAAGKGVKKRESYNRMIMWILFTDDERNVYVYMYAYVQTRQPCVRTTVCINLSPLLTIIIARIIEGVQVRCFRFSIFFLNYYYLNVCSLIITDVFFNIWQRWWDIYIYIYACTRVCTKNICVCVYVCVYADTNINIYIYMQNMS